MIIGIFLLGLMIVPIVAVEQRKKSKARKFQANFLKLAAERQLKIVQCDKWRFHAIGLDPAAKKLFYLKDKNGQQQEALIDLTKVKSCKAVNINRTAAENRKIIDRLALAFTTGEQAEKERQLEFYNAQEYPSLTEELGLLDKWQKLVSEQLKTASGVKSK